MAQNMKNRLPLCLNLLARPSNSVIPHRTTVVVKRKWDPPLVKRHFPVTSRRLKEKHYIYEEIRNDTEGPLPDIQCLLTQHVDGIGAEGELVSVDRQLFRSELLPSGAAVYPTTENIAEFQDPSRLPKFKRTPNALLTYRMLWGLNLPIKMNTSTQWTLDESHIRVALRLSGIHLDSLESVTLPKEPITQEHNEQEPFFVKVKVNGLDEAEVRCFIQPFSLNPNQQALLPESLDLELHRDKELVNKELEDKGIYHGNAD